MVRGARVGRVLRVVATTVGLVVLLIATALPVVVPVFGFPEPSGSEAIGTVTYAWTDGSRPELFTTDPDDHRELVAQVWYPAVNDPSAPRAVYSPDVGTWGPVAARVLGLPSFVFSHFAVVRTNAVERALPAGGGRRPVLVLLSGLYGYRQSNTFQIEELVSRGYVVVGLDQPGAAAAVRLPGGGEVDAPPRDEIQALIEQSGVDPRPTAPTLLGHALPEGVIPYFAQDVTFTLDRLAELDRADPQGVLTGRLDLDRVGTFGISLGGMVGAQACRQDARLKACLVMDVEQTADVTRDGLRQAVMFVSRDADTMRLERVRSGGWSERDIARTLSTMRATYERSPQAYYVLVPGMFHVNMTDVPRWSPLMSRMGLTGPVDGGRVFSIVNAYSVAFFDRHLRGVPVPLLDGQPAAYPEVTFGARRPG